jgi:hypothetical protein
MFAFTDILKNYLTRDAVKSLAKKIGASDKETEWAIEAANALIVSFLARKTSIIQNTAALSTVLDRNHDGAITDDITQFVENLSEGKINTDEGKEIVADIFTDHRSEALELLCSATGLTINAATTVLITIAPLVVKTIAEEQKKRQWSLKELSSQLGNATKSANNTLSNKLLQVFDKDNNGKISDDIWRSAKGLFKKVVA